MRSGNDVIKKTTSVTLTIGLILLDIVIKQQMANTIADGAPRRFIPGFLSLQYVENHGAAFGLFSGHSWLLIGIAIAFTAVAFWFFVTRPYDEDLTWIGVLMVSGAIGNLYDRFFLGYVRDYFRFDFMNFPIFNLADVYITMAVLFFLLGLIFTKHRKTNKNEKTTGKNNGRE